MIEIFLFFTVRYISWHVDSGDSLLVKSFYISPTQTSTQMTIWSILVNLGEPVNLETSPDVHLGFPHLAAHAMARHVIPGRWSSGIILIVNGIMWCHSWTSIHINRRTSWNLTASDNDWTATDAARSMPELVVPSSKKEEYRKAGQCDCVQFCYGGWIIRSARRLAIAFKFVSKHCVVHSKERFYYQISFLAIAVTFV